MAKLGLTQQQLADLVGMERSYISKILTSKALPSGYLLICLAQTEMDVGFILTGNGKKENILKQLEQLEFYVEQLEERYRNEILKSKS